MGDVQVIFTPIGATIYGGDKKSVTIYRFDKSEEEYLKDVEQAIKRYALETHRMPLEGV
jgi:hypothetical protein